MDTRPTAKQMRNLLPKILDNIARVQEKRPDLVLAGWPEVIGDKFSPMARAVSFVDGTLLVHVNNAALYSLLAQHEKNGLLKKLQEKFPSANVRNITFRIGGS